MQIPSTGISTLAELGVTASAAELNVLDGLTASTAELNYCDGLTSNAQTQIDGKAATSHTHVIGDTTGLQTALDAKVPTSYLDTDTSLAANSDLKIATQKATKAYADALIAANDAMVFRGVIDCSLNPNYPAADCGYVYRVSVPGKIGGILGNTVQAGDILLCLTDGTVSGTQAAVGANWNIIQVNIDGALTTLDINVSVQGYDVDLANYANAADAAARRDLLGASTGVWQAGAGGTGNAFFAVTGPTTSTKTYTIRDASTRIVTAPSALTATRIPFVDSNGELTDSANVTYASATNRMSIGGSTNAGYVLQVNGTMNVTGAANFATASGIVDIYQSGGGWRLNSSNILCGSGGVIAFTSGSNASGSSQDTSLHRHAASVFRLGNGSTGKCDLLLGPSTSTKNAAATLQIDSTTQGFLPPQHTTAQFAAIASKPAGLMAWDTDVTCPTAYDGTRVVKIPTILTGSATATAISDTVVRSIDVTVTGAVVGDTVLFSPPLGAAEELYPTASPFAFGLALVTSANTVSIPYSGDGGGTPTSHTWKVAVLKNG